MLRRDLLNFARSEAMDAAEDVAAGDPVNFRLRILEAAAYYRNVCDREEPVEVVIDALEDAFRRQGMNAG